MERIGVIQSRSTHYSVNYSLVKGDMEKKADIAQPSEKQQDKSKTY